MSVGDLLDRENDRPAYVRFETRAIPDKEATLKAGHHVSKDEDFALITPPYSKDCIEKKVESWFFQKEIDVKNGRVSPDHLLQWKKMYAAYKDGQDAPLDGVSVKEWNILSPAKCQNLINAGCRTIEDLSQANDEALRRIGMGAVDLKNKAIAYLQAAKDTSPLINQVTSLQKENEILTGSVESLQEQVTLLTRQLDSRSAQAAPIIDVPSPEVISAADVLTPSREELIERYEVKYGKKPQWKMKDETILKKLEE